MKIKKMIKGLINQLPYVKTLYAQSARGAFPNGHFYSPIVSKEQIKKREKQIWQGVNKIGILGIDLKTESQLLLVAQLSSFYSELPFKEEKHPNFRYYYNNNYFNYSDAIILYSLIRLKQPKKIIEIGSGYSSAVMLDTNELFFNNQIDLTFIDPYAERLNSLITEKDRKHSTIIEKDVQEISTDIFKNLEAGDILFIDSTHVSKTGSDVNYILFDILPILKPGVLIHFHDVFYPFEYPKDWVYRSFNWNEDYILRAFLMYNQQFSIALFPSYLHIHHPAVFAEMPLTYKNTGGSLWLISN